ncbi:MAG TPA: hypothetical protein EYP68_04665 [Candidatus Korarchaeota archaeon]|nr:hypothetical protein [Candidatus Korarchaeota archaeon]
MNSDIDQITTRLLKKGYIVRKSPERIEASKNEMKLILYPKLGGFLIIKYRGNRVFGKAYGSFSSPDDVFKFLEQPS